MNDTIQTKRCPKCEMVLPLSDFYRDKQTKDGLSCYCKACIKAKNAQHYQSNKDAIAQKHADYYQSNKDAILKKAADYYQENKDAILQKQAIYNATHKEEIKAYKAEYRANNKEAIAQKHADYYQTNKDKIKDYQAEHRDPMKNPLGFAKYMVAHYRQMDRERGFDDKDTISAQWFLDNIAYKPCAHCGLRQVGAIGVNRLKNTEGHIPSNCEPCCFKCNARENIRDQLERGIHTSQLRKKQSFKEFVKEHKKD